MDTKRPPRTQGGYRTIALLQDQLAKRMRFAWLMFFFGILIGFVAAAIAAVPPVWLGAL